MSVVWLVRPGAPLPDSAACAGVATRALDSADVEAAAHCLKGYEVLVTSDVPIDERLLERCRWVRGVVGVGDAARTAIDWPLLEKKKLQSTFIELSSDHPSLQARLADAIRVMDRQLRAYDAIAEDWEGT
jgi:hypothetical protein